MMMRSTLLAALCVILAATGAAGEDKYVKQSVFNDYLNPAQSESFLSLPGLDFNSSVGFSYFSSGQYGSGGLGYYMGHFSYRLGSSWTLNWDIGIQSSVTGADAMQKANLTVPNFDLTYRPNEKFMLRFQYNQYSGPMDYMMRRR